MRRAPNLDSAGSISELLADPDFRTCRVEGQATSSKRGESLPFCVPLATRIRTRLWMGGCLDGVRLPDTFRYVVALYDAEAYHIGARTLRYTMAFQDVLELPHEGELRAAAAEVLRMSRKGKTLVHCQAGLNRSGLVVALALILDGMAPPDAIALLRRKRSEAVLCNGVFEDWLLAQGPGT